MNFMWKLLGGSMGIIEGIITALVALVVALGAGLRYSSVKNGKLSEQVKQEEANNAVIKQVNTLQRKRSEIEEKHSNDSRAALDKRLHDDFRD